MSLRIRAKTGLRFRSSRPDSGWRSRRRAFPLHLEGLEGRTLLSASPAAGNLDPARVADAPYAPDEVLVQFRPGTNDVARAEARGRASAVLEERIETGPMRAAGYEPLERLAVPHGLSVAAAVQTLKADPAVRFAEPNYIFTLQDTSNDPYYTGGSLWGMYGDTTSPANPYGSQAGEAWASGATGSRSVYVGIIDEGVQFDHPDLTANFWTNP